MKILLVVIIVLCSIICILSYKLVTHKQKGNGTYFVSYRYPNGFGRCFVKRDAPVVGMDDIEGMEAAIRKDNGLENAIIVNWQRFEQPDKTEEQK